MRGWWIVVLLGLLAGPWAHAQEDPGQALSAAIVARDPAAVAAAIAAGARPDVPPQRAAAFAVVEALAATPDEATRATVLAFAEAAKAAGFAPEAQITGPMGNSWGSLASRLAALPGEDGLFLRVAGLTAPERRCNLLGQLIFGREGANFTAAAAVVSLIPAEQAATPACSLPFTMLANPRRQPPPTLVEAMLAAGLRPYPDALAELIRMVPPGEQGDGAFRRLTGLDLGAIARDTRDGATRQLPVLAQLGQDVLAERAARTAPLLGRWAALVESVPDTLACSALPPLAVRGWLSIGEESGPDPAWMEALRATTHSLALRCPRERLAEALAEAPDDRLWTRILRLRERPTFRLLLAAGLRPADLPALAGGLACAAEPRLLQTLIEAAPPEGAGLLARFMGCLGGVEARREGDMDTLAVILAQEAADEPVAGDAPIAVAAGIDRPDIAEVLSDHGARPARLSPERQVFWRHRRLAALVRTDGPPLPWEPTPDRVPAAPELIRLAPGLGAWLIHGDCGNVNCGYAIAVRDGRGYRLVLEDGGYGFRLERAIGGRARDVTIESRTNAAIHNVTLWRYDGRVYRRFRCRETVTEEEGGATLQRVSEGACAD